MKLRLALILICLLGIGLFARSQNPNNGRPKVSTVWKPATPLLPLDISTPPIPVTKMEITPLDSPRFHRHVPPPPPPLRPVKVTVVSKTAKPVPPPPSPQKPAGIDNRLQEDEHPLPPPPPPKPGKVKGAPVTPDTPPLDLEKA